MPDVSSRIAKGCILTDSSFNLGFGPIKELRELRFPYHRIWRMWHPSARAIAGDMSSVIRGAKRQSPVALPVPRAEAEDGHSKAVAEPRLANGGAP